MRRFILGSAALLAIGGLGGRALGAAEPGSSAQLSARLLPVLARVQPPAQVQFDVTRFDSLTARVLGDIFENAAARGIPTAPLIDRALEGAARKVGGSRIISAVRDLSAALADAREALGGQSTLDELKAGASALRAGIDENTLRSVRASRPGRTIELPLVVLTDIVGRGVPGTVAREAVTKLMQIPQNADEALMGLQSTVAKNSVRGPGMALQALNRYVKGTVSGGPPPSTPATTDRKPIRPPPP